MPKWKLCNDMKFFSSHDGATRVPLTQRTPDPLKTSFVAVVVVVVVCVFIYFVVVVVFLFFSSDFLLFFYAEHVNIL